MKRFIILVYVVLITFLCNITIIHASDGAVYTDNQGNIIDIDNYKLPFNYEGIFILEHYIDGVITYIYQYEIDNSKVVQVVTTDATTGKPLAEIKAPTLFISQPSADVHYVTTVPAIENTDIYSIDTTPTPIPIKENNNKYNHITENTVLIKNIKIADCFVPTLIIISLITFISGCRTPKVKSIKHEEIEVNGHIFWRDTRSVKTYTKKLFWCAQTVLSVYLFIKIVLSDNTLLTIIGGGLCFIYLLLAGALGISTSFTKRVQKYETGYTIDKTRLEIYLDDILQLNTLASNCATLPIQARQLYVSRHVFIKAENTPDYLIQQILAQNIFTRQELQELYDIYSNDKEQYIAYKRLYTELFTRLHYEFDNKLIYITDELIDEIIFTYLHKTIIKPCKVNNTSTTFLVVTCAEYSPVRSFTRDVNWLMTNYTPCKEETYTVDRKEAMRLERSKMTQDLRNAIKARDNYTCQICGLSVLDEPNLLLEVDHIVPIAAGGKTEASNLQTLCWKCNREKGART